VYSKIKDYQLDYQLHKRLDGRVGINGILRSKLKKMEKEKVDMVYTLTLREASQPYQLTWFTRVLKDKILPTWLSVA
jgi:hypothetical protein